MAITRDFLKNLGITDEHTLDAVMQEHDALAAAHSAALGSLQSKYDSDTQTLRSQLDSQAFDFAAEKFISGYRFSSKAAEKAALADFKAKGLKASNGVFGEDAAAFMEEYRNSDPAAFLSDGHDGQSEGTPLTWSQLNSNSINGTQVNGSSAEHIKPNFTSFGSMGAGGNSEKSTNPFDGLFNFTSVK